jgi:hypothetical protein
MKRLKFVLLAVIICMAVLIVSSGRIFSQVTPSPIIPTQIETWAFSAGVTDTTATDMLAAPGTGLRWYVTKLQCINVSASTQAIALVKTGSAVDAEVACPPASTANGMVVFNPPIRQSATNTKMTFTSSASVTTNYFIMAGYKGR